MKSNVLKFFPIALLSMASIVSYSCDSNEINMQYVENPSSLNSKYPRLFTDNKGAVHMSWLHEIDEEAKLQLATLKPLTDGDQEYNWSKKVTVASSDDWFINWADFPSVIGYNGEPMALHWLDKTPGHTFSYDVTIQTLLKGELNETADTALPYRFKASPLVPHDDGTASEHGFVSMSVIDSLSFYAIWLDGRNTQAAFEHSNTNTTHPAEAHSHDGHVHPEELSYAMSLRGGKISRNGIVLSSDIIDETVCDCCNTSMVNTEKGLLAVYRNRSQDEIRDIYISRYENGVWSAPKAVNNDGWKIAACPVNGPQIDLKDGTTAVAWYTGANDTSKVKLSFSDDYGDTFSDPIIVSEGNTLGRIDLVMTEDNSAWISFVERVEDAAQFRIQKIDRNGTIIQDLVLDAIDASRRSGFPQITEYNDGLLVAWTDWGEKASTVRTRYLK